MILAKSVEAGFRTEIGVARRWKNGEARLSSQSPAVVLHVVCCFATAVHPMTHRSIQISAAPAAAAALQLCSCCVCRI